MSYVKIVFVFYANHIRFVYITLMKVQILADQLDDIFLSLEEQLRPLNKAKLKLLKTLQKIIVSNTEIIIPPETLLAEKEETMDQMIEKLAFLRREGPLKCASRVEKHYKEIEAKIEALVKEEEEGSDEVEEESALMDFSSLKEINEGVPDIICKFERAMKVVEEASKNDGDNEKLPEDVALMYFFKS